MDVSRRAHARDDEERQTDRIESLRQLELGLDGGRLRGDAERVGRSDLRGWVRRPSGR